MSVTTEAPAASRIAAGTPASLALLRQVIEELWSRRRLVRYLVLAEMKRCGSDTLLGNLWWVLDPLLQLVITHPRGHHRPGLAPDYPLFIFAAI